MADYEKNQTDKELDWELSEDYYKEDTNKKQLSLEDFIDHQPEEEVVLKKGELEKTVEDVKTVLKLASEGQNIEQIALATGLDKDYIFNIQVCAQGFREDNEIAVAHLVMMS